MNRRHRSSRDIDKDAGLLDVHNLSDLASVPYFPGTTLFGARQRKQFDPVNLATFTNNFHLATGWLLEIFDFKHVLVAGGSVLRTLIPGRKDASWEQRDFDMFMHGIEPYELFSLAQRIVKHIVLAAATAPGKPNTCTVVHGRNGVKLCVKNEDRELRFDIVMRCYGDPCEILYFFDLDCCKVGFNGMAVVTTLLGARAFQSRENIIQKSDLAHMRSYNLDARVLKYALLRGFALKLVGFGSDDVQVMRAALGRRSMLDAAKELRGYPKILAAHVLSEDAPVGSSKAVEVEDILPASDTSSAGDSQGAVVDLRAEVALTVDAGGDDDAHWDPTLGIPGLLDDGPSGEAMDGQRQTLTSSDEIASWFEEEGLGEAHQVPDPSTEQPYAWQVELSTLKRDLARIFRPETRSFKRTRTK
ncbi:hypothetical protein WJX72_010891 [[Myrmecia] bisecta]|uniref:Uncharacterized protein n=1 Tax=[Myrmecia] bisecta TaxID=41462 RepID=A0AAW1PKW3_9CHLO